MKRSESHPVATTRGENNNEATAALRQQVISEAAATAALRQQVISLVDELKQTQTANRKSKEAEDKAERKFEMLKTQTEMEENKTKSQVRVGDICDVY